MERINGITATIDRGNLFPINDLVLARFKECTPKILVYADGLTFDNSDFGLSDFVNTLKNTAIHSMLPIVKTAHKNSAASSFIHFYLFDAI